MGKSCHLFSAAWSREMPQLMEAKPVRILPWDFYNWIGDRKTLLGVGNYKMWNSGSISSLPCGGNQTAMSKNIAKTDREVPTTPKHLVPIIPKAQPQPCSPGPLTSLSFHCDLQNPPNIYRFCLCSPIFPQLATKKWTLMLITSKHYVCFKQVLCPLKFFYAKVFL